MAELILTRCLGRQFPAYLIFHLHKWFFFHPTRLLNSRKVPAYPFIRDQRAHIFIKHYFLAETTHDLYLRRMSFWKRNQASGRNPMSRMRLPYYVQEKNKEVDCFWCQIVKSKMCKRNKQKEYFLPIAKDYGFVNLLVEAKVGSILVFHTN